MDWQDLLNKENLTDTDLLRIPGASNENYITAKNYFCRKYGVQEGDLLQGLNISSQDFNNPQNWLNPLQEQRFNINVFRQTPGLFTHHDYYQAGVDFQFSDNSLFMLLFKALPASRIIKEINRNVKKFNNDYSITPLDFRKGSAYFLIEPYPFYRRATVGHECRFAQGVFSANFEIHNIRSYTTRHLICFQRLENILSRAYGHLPLDLQDDGRLIRINGTPVGRRVRLQTRPIGGREVWTNAVDGAADLSHPQTPANAVEITRDFTWEGRTLFYQGEFYNAPYCLLHLRWHEPSAPARIGHLFRRNRLMQESLQKMSEEIEFANSQLFEAREALHQSERKSRIFQIYTRQSLVQAVDAGKDPTAVEPRETQKAVLFNDIRGFTNLAEFMGPRETVAFLNRYFDTVNGIILAHQGEIDKIIGDCVMAEFDSPDRAVQAAIACQQALQGENRRRIQNRLPKIAAGFGINCGPVITGNIGSRGKMDYTLIGDTVNAASRLEALTKHYQTQILISGEVKAQLRQNYRLRFLDAVYVKGKQQPLHIYDVYQHTPPEIQEKIADQTAPHQHAYAHYRRGSFAQALRQYNTLIQEIGPHRYGQDLCADPPLHFFQRRCRTLVERHSQGLLDLQAWDGIYEFKDK